MKKIYLTIAMMAAGIAGVRAQDFIVPDDAPRETWQLVYDDYRTLDCCNDDYQQSYAKDMSFDVTVVRGDNCLYIQGISKSCPDSWIKIGGTDDFLNNVWLWWSDQPVTVNGSTKYVSVGGMNYNTNPYRGGRYYSINAGSSTTPKKMTWSSGVLKFQYENVGFWLSDIPDYGFEVYYKYSYEFPNDPEDLGFPEKKDCYLNPRLIDKSYVSGIMNVKDDEAEAPIYTLSGVLADPDHLTPGIYVSRGKKIIVK